MISNHATCIDSMCYKKTLHSEYYLGHVMPPACPNQAPTLKTKWTITPSENASDADNLSEHSLRV